LLFGGSKPYSSSAGGIIDCRTPVKTAETMAALGAVQFSKEVGFLFFLFNFFYAIFEGDAAHVILEINSTAPYLSRIGHFIKSIQSEKQRFCSCSFVFAPRDSNSASHILAKEAACNITDLCWLEDSPKSISSIVLRKVVCP
jgi:hypothetical protein